MSLNVSISRPESTRLLTVVFSITLALTVFALPRLASAGQPPSGDAIYSQAIAAMRSQPMPPYIRYRLTSEHHGVTIFAYSRKDASHAFLGAYPKLDGSSETRYGVAEYNSLTGAGQIRFQGQKVPFMALPFPYAPEVRALVATGSDAHLRVAGTSTSNSTASFPIVATIRMFYSKNYMIENAGTALVSNTPCYHLKMTARDGDTSAYPLTDIYVDVTSHLIRSVVMRGGERGFFEGGGGFGRFDFKRVGPYWLVYHIHVEADGHFLVLHQSGSSDVTYDHFTFPQQLSGWVGGR